MEELANPELVLLLLIAERPGINGYAIRRLAEERGLAAWAGVASSSIYIGLKRIESRGLAASAPDHQKRDRGPRGQAFRPTTAGLAALRAAIADGLATSREHDPRFNIALSGIEQLGLDEAADRLAERAEFLGVEAGRLAEVRTSQAGLPLAADLLFERITSAIEAERRWTQTAAARLRNTRNHGGGIA